jgi:hypothetical protein
VREREREGGEMQGEAVSAAGAVACQCVRLKTNPIRQTTRTNQRAPSAHRPTEKAHLDDEILRSRGMVDGTVVLPPAEHRWRAKSCMHAFDEHMNVCAH